MPPRRRQLNFFQRTQERFAKSRPGGWIAINVSNKVDRRLLRWSNGRVSSFIGEPVGLLEHVGAKSGSPRETPLLYLADGDRVVLVASQTGRPNHPAWYHNLKAHPEVNFRYAGKNGRFRAREADGPERDQLWAKVNDLYAGYEEYQDRAGGRRIPVMVLEPVDRTTPPI